MGKILTDAEVHDSLATLYKSKQALFAINEAFSNESAAIMDRARQEVEALRATYEVQRQAAQDAVDVAQKMLEQGG